MMHFWWLYLVSSVKLFLISFHMYICTKSRSAMIMSQIYTKPCCVCETLHRKREAISHKPRTNRLSNEGQG